MNPLATLTRASVVLGLAAITGVGCVPLMRQASTPPAAVSRPPAAASVPVAPAPASPFADAAVSFFVSGFGLVRGEQVIVRVCVGADHSIVSSAVVQSSGDPRFDQLAVGWARQVRLRTQTAQTAHAAPVAPCGAVRVQMRRVPDEPVTGTRANLLG